MEHLLYTDNALTTMSGTLSNGGTTLVMSASTGSKFPNPGAGEAFILTLYELNESSQIEYVEKTKVTARTADTCTIARDIDGTVAAAGGPASGGYAYPSDPARTVYCSLRWTSIHADEMLTPAAIAASDTKDAIVDADIIGFLDSAASNSIVKTTWSNLKSKMWAAWGALISAGTAKTTPVDADAVAVMDSAASNATKKVTLTSLWANYIKAKADALYDAIGAAAAVSSSLSSHASNISNPHSVTAAQVGLGSAENKTFATGVADATHAATSKTTPTGADELPLSDSAANYSIKKLTITSLVAYLASTFAKKTADADMAMANYKIGGVKTFGLNGVYDNGSKSASFTLDFNNGQAQKVTLTGTGALTITLTAPAQPGIFRVNFTNAGLRTITFAFTSGTPAIRKRGGTALSAFTASGVDKMFFEWDGTDYHVEQSLDWKA